MKAVWKFPIEITDDFELELPAGAEILYVDSQRDTEVNMWALVDTEAPKMFRKFHLAGTGYHIDEALNLTKANHVASFQMQGGALVFHLFEVDR